MRIIVRNEHLREMALQHIRDMDISVPQEVRIEEYRKRRSLDQNAFLHAVPLPMIAEATGFSLDDIKDYLLGEAFGWSETEMFGTINHKPLRRSSSLNTKEFAWFIDWIEQWAAQTLGIVIPRPNEEIE